MHIRTTIKVSPTSGLSAASPFEAISSRSKGYDVRIRKRSGIGQAGV